MSTHAKTSVDRVMRCVANDLRGGHWHAALQRLQSLEQTDREIDEVMYCEASILMQLRHWQDALELLDALAHADDSRVVVLLDLASCLIELERDREALNVLAVNKDKLCSLAFYHVLLARVAARHWKLTQAMSCVEVAIAIDPSMRRHLDEIADLKAVLS